MQKNRIVIILIGCTAVLALLAAGCASAPETVPEEPVVAEQKTETTTKDTKTDDTPKPEKEYAQANELRELIVKYGINDHAKSEFETAESEFKKGETAYGKYNDTAKTAFEKAIQGYRFVIEKAFPAVSRRDKTEEYIKLADGLKASVAMKTEYAAAMTKYDAAVQAQEDAEYEKAGLLFVELETLFKDIYEKTKVKKEKAEAALLDLDKELDDFEELANDKEGGAQ